MVVAAMAPACVAVALLLGSAGCSSDALAPAPEAMGCAEQAVIYGIDDREEVSSAPEPWRGLAEATTVALIGADVYAELERDPGLASRYSASSELQLCAGERFADQPSLAECSGILLAPDLVLTAAHCLESDASCSDYVYVRRFEASAGGSWSGFDGSEAYRCRDVLARLEGVQPDGSFTDAALIRLTTAARAPSPHELTRIRATPAEQGEELVLMGHPLGLPMKISGGGHVVEPRREQRDYFGAELDSFEGGSGGAVFDMTGALLGVVVAGQDDFVLDRAEECYRARVTSSDPSKTRYEQVIHVAAALEAMCRAGSADACALLDAAVVAPPSGCDVPE